MGLHGYGTFAKTEVSLISDDEQHWELQIRTGQITLQFSIPSPDMIYQILEFLQAHTGKTRMRAAKQGDYVGVKTGTPIYRMVAEMQINESIRLSKDGESATRFVLAISSNDNQVFFELVGKEVIILIAAFKELWNDWTLSG